MIVIMKKRNLALVLALMLLISLVSGCKPSQGTSENSKSTEDLKWYMLGNSTANPDLELVFSEVSKMAKEKIGVGVKMNMVPNADYTRKLQTMLNSGEEFDLAFTSNTYFSYPENSRRGSFVEIGPLLEEYGKDLLNAIPADYLSQAQVDGKLYGIPTYKEKAWQFVWQVNGNVAEKYGIDLEKDFNVSLEEMEPMFEKIKNGENDDQFRVIYPFAEGFISMLPYERLAGTVFTIKFDPENIENTFDGKIHNLFETDEAFAHLKTMRKYFEKGYISRDVDDAASNPMKSGKWFVILQSHQPQFEISESILRGYPIKIVERHTPVASGTTGAVNAIPITSKRPEKATEFLNILNSDEKLRRTVSYGIEGVHHNIEDGRRVMTDVGLKNYASLPHYALGNLFLTGISPNDNADKWEAFKEYNNKSVDSPALGFFFDSDPVRSEMAALENVVKQYQSDLLFGRVDPETILPEFVAKMKAAGGDKIKAEMQKQFDAFLAAKK